MWLILKQLVQFIFPQKSVIDILKKYHIPQSINVQIQRSPDGWFCAHSSDLPGLVTQAQSREELIVMINDAVLTYFDVPRREARIIYEKIIFDDRVTYYEGVLSGQIA